MTERSEQVEMADLPLKSYPPLKRTIKLEISEEEQQEVNSVEEANWTLQLLEDSVAMEDLVPIIAYPPLPPVHQNVKKENPGDNQDVNYAEEENLTLQFPKDSALMTDPHPLIAYPPIQRIIKQESLEEHQEVDNIEEGNQNLQQDAGILGELDAEEEGSDYDQGSERSEHSSLEDVDEPDNSLSADMTDDEDLISSPEAGPSKEPTRQVEKSNHHKKKDNYNLTVPKKRPFKCSKCNKSYRQKRSLNVHLKYECGVEPQFPCTQCGSQFKLKHHLKKHMMNIHKIDREQLDNHGAGLKERKETPFKCTKCDSSYKQKRTLDQHTKDGCGVAFNCTLCKQNFTWKTSLRNHLLDVHNIPRRKLDKYEAGSKDRSVNPFKCDQCGRTYKSKKNLAAHLRVECGLEPSFSCPQCNGRYKHKSNLKRHLIEIHKVERSQLAAFGLGPVVRPENQFKCDRCGSSYKRKQGLETHLTEKCGK